MRVGVTGSTGLIGRALVAALESRGDDVVIFRRPTSASSSAANVIRWDPAHDHIEATDMARVGALDALVHLAGAGIADRRWSARRRIELLESRVASTSLLARAFAEQPPAVVASGSAIGWYGSRGDELLDEHSTSGAGYLAEICRAWEEAATPLAHAGSRLALLRTGIVMDAHGGALAKQLPLFRFGLGGRLASGHQWLSPISLRDEVRAILFVLDGSLAGPVNLVGPTPLTNREFTQTLARALHRPAVAAVPAVALRLALGRELCDEAILASQRVRPGALNDAGFTFTDSDTAAMLSWALAN